MTSKFALVIANTEYQDASFAKLTAPGKDAEEFAQVLRDLASFNDVQVLLNEGEGKTRRSIARFFAERKRDDLLLLYFSGHGVRNDVGQLFLAANDTEINILEASGIPADFVTQSMNNSRSQRQLLILDCCNSGAFAYGSKSASAVGKSMGIASAFEGSGFGRVVLTATDATQYAWEGDKVIGDTQKSVFTHFLIEGLKGEADRDGDGRIDVDELYDYAYEQVVRRTPKQTPSKWSYKQQGDIVLRDNLKPREVKPAPLPPELFEMLSHPNSSVREEDAGQYQLSNLYKATGPAKTEKKHRARLERERWQKSVIMWIAGVMLLSVALILLYGYVTIQLKSLVTPTVSITQEQINEDSTSAVESSFTPFPVDGLGTSSLSYLPIAVGNTWTYAVIVNPGQNREFLLSLSAPDQQVAHFIDPSYPCSPGTYSETYTIISQVDETTWEVKVDHQGECQGVYQSAKQVLWSLEPAVLGEEPAKRIVEHIEYDPSGKPPGFGLGDWPNNILNPPTHEVTILWMSNESFASKVYKVPNYISEIYIGGSSDIETNAGLFNGCLGILESVTPELLNGQESDFQEGWTIFNGFCPGVGLAKREQKNRDGEIMYSMSLVSYELISSVESINNDSKIAFVTDRDRPQNWEIYTMNADGTEQVNLTNNSANDGYPVWSPDRDKIAFSSNRDGNNEIYVMDFDGGNVIRLTNNTSNEDCPSWSPNGKLIAFSSDRDGNNEIYIVDINDKKQTRLTVNTSDDNCPSWSVDGTLAFMSERNGQYDIYSISSDGGNEIRLTDGDTDSRLPQWSPDGKKLMYVSNNVIQILDLTTSDVTKIAGYGPVYTADWSPDGKKIVFMSGHDGNLEIYVMDITGNDVIKLTNNPASAYEGDPSWSP